MDAPTPRRASMRSLSWLLLACAVAVTRLPSATAWYVPSKLAGTAPSHGRRPVSHGASSATFVASVRSSTDARFDSLGLRLSSSDDSETSAGAPASPDFAGKTLFQRTFYRLTPGARVAQPDAIVVEERIRFQADPNDSTKARPVGGVTLILREGTAKDEITDEFFRLDVPSLVGGSGASESTIATALFLAANPQICQGNMLQLASGDGVAAVLGCIGAGYALTDKEQYKAKKKEIKKQKKMQQEAQNIESDGAATDDVSIAPSLDRKGDEMLPPRLAHLTLTDETSSGLQQLYATVKGARLSPGKITIEEKVWSRRPGVGGPSTVSRRGSTMNGAYRTIVGCDIPYTFPSAKELARCVAHSLLPSDVVAQSQVEAGSKRSGSGGASGTGGGFLGIEAELETSTPASPQTPPEVEIDPAVPPAFVHIAPERTLISSEDAIYLRQFLEQGYRMDVSTNYFKVERLSFHYQTLDTETPTLADEESLDDMDLELLDEATPSYQSLIAIHHPDYAGDGSGELFFPMENGAYQSGSRGTGTYLEPETEGGSFLM